jgi:nucleoside-diphosphate-sugar epimerase
MSILVTGAGGFVGINVLEVLLAQGHEVVAFNKQPLPAAVNAVLAGHRGRLSVVTGDVRDRRLVADTIASHRVRRILHGAAITLGPNSAIATATDALDVNTVSTAVLLEEGRRAGIERFVYPSSGSVYGNAAFGDAPITEQLSPTPATLYGFTKLASERLVAEAARAFGLSTATARITAVFGPWEHDTGLRETLSPPFQIAAAMASGRSLVLAEKGERDWTSSVDISRALVLLVTTDRLPHDLYNLSLVETWNARLVAEALAPRFPGMQLSTMPAPEGAGAIAYHDDLSRARRPMHADRFRQDFNFRFMTPAEAVAYYENWIGQRGDRFFDLQENEKETKG